MGASVGLKRRLGHKFGSNIPLFCVSFYVCLEFNMTLSISGTFFMPCTIFFYPLSLICTLP